jgi:hypothetical protein
MAYGISVISVKAMRKINISESAKMASKMKEIIGGKSKKSA